MDKRKELDLQKKATQIRKYIIEEVFSAKSGHVFFSEAFV